MKPKVLVIDDEAIIRGLCAEVIKGMGLDVTAVGDPLIALEMTNKNNFDLIITDVKMPKMSGIELMKKIKSIRPDMPFIIITGYGTYELVIEALKEGACDFINKPFQSEELKLSIKNTLEKIEIMNELNRLRALTLLLSVSEEIVSSHEEGHVVRLVLENAIKQTTAGGGVIYIGEDTGLLIRKLSIPDNVAIDERAVQEAYEKKMSKLDPRFLVALIKSMDKIIGCIVLVEKSISFTQADLETASILANQLGIALGNISLLNKLHDKINDREKLFFGTIKALSNAIDAKSHWTKGHSERVTRYSLMIAKELNFDKDTLKLIELAAALHDIGKIGTYDRILEKPSKLSPEEYEIVKKHAEEGAAILSPIKELKGILNIIRHHHERYDGTGYPDGIKGEDIPLFARILAVADAYDSMTAERPYRKTPGSENAVEELIRCSGTQFDPKVVNALIKALKKNNLLH